MWDHSRGYGHKQVADPADKPCTVTFVTTPKRITAITGLDTTLAEAVLPVGTIVTITASERVTILRIEH